MHAGDPDVLWFLTMNNKYGNYSLENRIGREEYFAKMAIFIVLSVLIQVVGGIVFTSVFLAVSKQASILIWIVCISSQLALTWWFLGYGAKRCHDYGRSGFYQLIPFYVLIMLSQEGDVGDNEYGPNPNGDHVEAYAYFNLASSTDEDARSKCGILEKRMSPDDLLRGRERTMELQKEIAAKIAAKLALLPSSASARMTPGEVKIFVSHKAKAEKGDRAAQYVLGGCYAGGFGVAEDTVEAVKWYHKAAEQGEPRAQFWLGVSYANGNGVAQDLVEAVKWFHLSAIQGDTNAQEHLAHRYYKGEGVTKNDFEAYAYWNLSRSQPFIAIPKQRWPTEMRLRILQRTKELQTVIDANLVANLTGK